MNLYEGMFVIDNDLVREDWQAAKSIITDTLEKHGAKIVTARRWDERALAYPIKGRRRATYLLSYFEIEGQKNEDVARDLEIQDGVLRYLVTAAAELPEGEVEASQAEGADDFTVPPPPADTVGSYRPIQGEEEESEEGSGEESGEGGDAKAEGDKSAAEGDKSAAEGDTSKAEGETKSKDGQSDAGTEAKAEDKQGADGAETKEQG